MLEKNMALLKELDAMEKGGKTGKTMLHWDRGTVRGIDNVRSAPIISRKILVNDRFIDNIPKKYIKNK